jgi:hypothetical protein
MKGDEHEIVKGQEELELINSNKIGNQDTHEKLQKDCNDLSCKRSTCQKCLGNNGNTLHVCEEYPTHKLSSPTPELLRMLHVPVPVPLTSSSTPNKSQLSSPDSFPYNELPGTPSSSLSSQLLHSHEVGDCSPRTGMVSEVVSDSTSDSEEGELGTRGDCEGLKS